MKYTYSDLLAMFGIGGAHPGGLALTRAILSELPLNQDTYFLEVGCGTGQTTAYIMSNHPCKLFAVDNHPLMISKAKKRLQFGHEKVELLEASAEQLPFKDQMFHYVLSESVTVFTNIKESVNEYFRILKNNGELILIEMTLNQPLDQDEAKELIQFYKLNQLNTEADWIDLLKEAGFKDVVAHTIVLEELHREDQDFTEFDMSENIDHQLFHILDTHEKLTLQYSNKLGFRVFICKKQ
ncbi:class I SAM-dependent methyltransferase [Bacillus sp. DJP31]|uniref:class I SAM-dependent methyltransferase n=1 Tax=Bacillus sp. DJP31 TaxID=3409789 RepID=UPI003BB64927